MLLRRNQLVSMTLRTGWGESESACGSNKRWGWVWASTPGRTSLRLKFGHGGGSRELENEAQSRDSSVSPSTWWMGAGSSHRQRVRGRFLYESCWWSIFYTSSTRSGCESRKAFSYCWLVWKRLRRLRLMMTCSGSGFAVLSWCVCGSSLCRQQDIPKWCLVA